MKLDVQAYILSQVRFPSSFKDIVNNSVQDQVLHNGSIAAFGLGIPSSNLGKGMTDIYIWIPIY